MFFGQEVAHFREIESEKVHSVLENKNLCALSPNFLSPSQASSEEQMSGGLQPPSRFKGPCGQYGFQKLWVSCYKILPCTNSLFLSSSLRCTMSWQM